VSHGHDDFASEPVRGLPARLPAGETMLWQGEPRAWELAKEVFHIRAVAAYFAAILLWRFMAVLGAGSTLEVALIATASLLPVMLGALGLLAVLAVIIARTTVYTITDRRIVMRFGVAITKAVNVPYSQIVSASVHGTGGSAGDIAVALKDGTRVGYVHFWPHVRPFRFRSPEPTLRGLADVGTPANILAEALAAATGVPASSWVSPAAPVAKDRAPAPTHVPAAA